MYTVSVTTTLEEQNIHIEKFGDPGSLVYAVEGADPSPVARLAWRGYLRNHKAHSLALHLQAALPRWRLVEVERGFNWLLRQIIRSEAHS